MKEAHELLNTRTCHVERVAVDSVYEGSTEPPAPEVNFKLAFVFLFDQLLSLEQSTLPGLVSVSLTVSKEKAMKV